MNELSRPPSESEQPRRSLAARVLIAFPFLFFPIFIFVLVVIAFVMPYLTNAKGY